MHWPHSGVKCFILIVLFCSKKWGGSLNEGRAEVVSFHVHSFRHTSRALNSLSHVIESVIRKWKEWWLYRNNKSESEMRVRACVYGAKVRWRIRWAKAWTIGTFSVHWIRSLSNCQCVFVLQACECTYVYMYVWTARACWPFALKAKRWDFSVLAYYHILVLLRRSH